MVVCPCCCDDGPVDEATAADLDQTGRPLAAVKAERTVPDEPLARLWHAATLLREHRGDGHVAALIAARLDGAEALVRGRHAVPESHRRTAASRRTRAAG
jgi:Helix-turn-helix family